MAAGLSKRMTVAIRWILSDWGNSDSVFGRGLERVRGAWVGGAQVAIFVVAGTNGIECELAGRAWFDSDLLRSFSTFLWVPVVCGIEGAA